MPPEGADLVLTTHIPDGETDALHGGDGLHVKPDGRDGANVLVQLYFVQNRSFSYKIINKIIKRWKIYK